MSEQAALLDPWTQGKDKTPEERRIAICIFDDVAEQCREAALKYYDMYLPFLLEACGDENPDIRQNETGSQLATRNQRGLSLEMRVTVCVGRFGQRIPTEPILFLGGGCKLSLSNNNKRPGICSCWMAGFQLASTAFTLGTVAVLPFYTLMVVAPKA